MPTAIAIRRGFSVQSLMNIDDPEFAHWYGLGVWWAMYGDDQGNGPYDDYYLIENISRNLQAGRYDSLSSPWFAHAGFYFGMLHGGTLDPATRQLRTCHTFVVLTDPDFARGYQQRRQDGHLFTDHTLVQTIHQWALSCVAGPALAYELGSLTATLSRAIVPAPMPVVSVP